MGTCSTKVTEHDQLLEIKIVFLIICLPAPHHLAPAAAASTLPACMAALDSCTCWVEEMQMLLSETSGNTSLVTLAVRLSAGCLTFILQLPTGGRWSEDQGHPLAVCRDTPWWSTRTSSMSSVGSSASVTIRRHQCGCLISR